MTKKIKTIDDLAPDRANLNKGTERGRYLLETSVSKLGLGRSVLADKNGTLIAGNKTTEVAGELGIGKVRVIETDGTELIVVQRTDLDMTDPDDPRARQLAFADNQVGAQNLAWDAEALLAAAQADDLSDFVRDDELKAMIESAQEEESNTGGNSNVDAEPQIDKAEELRQKWDVQSGQMWQLGEHRIICGDCTDRAVVERVMGGEKVRLEFSDPPYDFETKGGGVLSKSSHMVAIEKAGINKFDPLSIQLLSETSVFCCNKNLVPVYIELANKNNVSWDLCFYKKENTPPNFGGHLMTDTEYLPVIGKQSPNSGMEKELYSKAYIGGLDENHKVAWQKPIGLVEKFVKLFSKQNEIVIDRFLCTGTTLIACENLSRKCRAIEISPAYVAVALQRWADATGKTPKLLQ